MNKQTQEALKMAIEAMEMWDKKHIIEMKVGERWIDLSYAVNACKEALEQPITRDWKETIDERIARDSEFKEALKQPAVAELNDEYLRDTHVIGLEQPAQEPVALLEALSDLEHQQWMKWAKSIIDSEPISEARKQRWLTMMIDYKDLPDNIKEYDREWARKVMALYTHPHQWQGLTDDEMEIIWISMDKCSEGNLYNDFDFARAIEQALKEKNHG